VLGLPAKAGQVAGLAIENHEHKSKYLKLANKCAYTCELACSHAVKLSAKSSACFNTVSIAFCCLSGG
jgi:hypothetical protein